MWVEVRDRSELRSESVVDLRVVDILVVDVRLDMDELTTIGLSVIGTLADMSERSLRFCSWWTPRLGVTVWHYCVRVHSNIASSRVWVHGTIIHHSW